MAIPVTLQLATLQLVQYGEQVCASGAACAVCPSCAQCALRREPVKSS